MLNLYASKKPRGTLISKKINDIVEIFLSTLRILGSITLRPLLVKAAMTGAGLVCIKVFPGMTLAIGFLVELVY